MIYLDNGASTKPFVEVLEKYNEIALNYYGNPSSLSKIGMECEKLLKSSAQTIGSLINASHYSEIYFTSGGTEGNNLAVLGTAKGYHRTGKHIITSKIEHPAIAEPYKVLEEEGFEVTYINVDEKGYLKLEELENAIREDTILVSIIYINNEIGTIQNVEQIGNIIKEKNSKTLFHVDGVQAFGKIEIDVRKSKIDMLSTSGHKFHTPKGMGFLYIAKGLRIKPLMFGGGQQKEKRPGTENVAGAVALALSGQMCYENFEETQNHVYGLKEVLLNGILDNIENVYINGDNLEKASPFVLNVAFRGLRSQVLLNALEDKNIFVSSGSACNSRKKVQSSVLEALGKEDDDINGSIRFSFSKFNTMEEILECVNVLKEIVPMLRRFNRKR